MIVEARCPTCAGGTRGGLLWLGGDDWLTCPNCNGTQRIELIEQRFAPVERTISIPGVGTLAVPKHHTTFERMH